MVTSRPRRRHESASADSYNQVALGCVAQEESKEMKLTREGMDPARRSPSSGKSFHDPARSPGPGVPRAAEPARCHRSRRLIRTKDPQN